MSDERRAEVGRFFAVKLSPAFQQMVRVELRDEASSGYDFAGFTNMEGIEWRLRAKYTPATAIPNILRDLTAGGTHQLEFDASPWESYEAFRKFWIAGMPPRDPH